MNLKQPKRQWSGFTLIELMICLSLIASLSTLLAPRLLKTVPELVLERQAQQLQSLLSNARTLALVHDSSTIVCPASTASVRPLNTENALVGDWCDPHGNWQAGVNVVLDRNQNRSIDAADNLVFHLAWYTSRGLPPQVQWRSFRDGDQIEFLANGMTNWQNGRFIMCSPTHRIPAKHLIINAAGRSYIREVPSPDCGWSVGTRALAENVLSSVGDPSRGATNGSPNELIRFFGQRFLYGQDGHIKGDV